MKVNNDKFFEESEQFGTLVETLVMWFRVRYECTRIRNIEKNMPTIVQVEGLKYSQLDGCVLYTSEEFNKDVTESVKAILNKNHPFVKYVDELYKKYNPNLDNALDCCTDKEIAELKSKIDFKYSTLANLLLVLGRRVLNNKNLGIDVPISVCEMEEEHSIYQFNSEQPSEIIKEMSIEDFRYLIS
jgi:hypothetical protein